MMTEGSAAASSSFPTGYNLKGDPCAKIDLETLCRAVGIRRVRVVDPYGSLCRWPY